MENILLTDEEIKKRNELFAYEMTQVVLNLKGKYENKQVQSPIKEFESSGKDFNKHLDYLPLNNNEIENQTLTIPDIHSSPVFFPLKEVKALIEYENDIQSVVHVKNQAGFTPLKNISIDTTSPVIPGMDINIEYNLTVDTVENIPAHEVPKPVIYAGYKPIGLMVESPTVKEIPDINAAGTYKPYKNKKVISPPVKIPSSYASFDFIPQTGDSMTLPEINTPKSDMNIEYKPFKIMLENIAAQEIPDVTAAKIYKPYKDKTNTDLLIPVPTSDISLSYTPLSPDVMNLPKQQDIPASDICLNYTSFSTDVMSLAEQEIPAANISIEYNPAQITVEKIEPQKIPNITKINEYKRLSFSPLDHQNIGLWKQDIPEAVKNIEYKPALIISETRIAHEIPVTDINIEYKPAIITAGELIIKAADIPLVSDLSYKSLEVRPKIAPIECPQAMPVDFYEMWINL